MPRKQNVSVENHFIGGLKTEYTGLNFPENSCTEVDNCVFNRIGSVTRRKGFNYELNPTITAIDRTDKAITSYIWNNADTTGTVKLYVLQIGSTLHFFKLTTATIALPLSAQKSVNTINLATFTASGAPSPATIECQFTSGDGKLFVLHPYLEPFFIEYTPTDTFTATVIVMQIRDFTGVEDGQAVTQTTLTLSDLHKYNLLNQGWRSPQVDIINSFFSAMAFYPSNADVWWLYNGPNDTGRKIFDPVRMYPLVVRGNSPAPKGSHLLGIFTQDRSGASGITGIPVITSGSARPQTGAFFAGRMFYAGVQSREYIGKIYFSQIAERKTQYGNCYQENDPTSETTFDLLPSDGGVIVIPDAGIIYKLISIQNGLLVFAANGVWFITGSTGIGFTATDYTVSKISSVQTISATSFINFQGFPIWWNEEGIWGVAPAEGSIAVNSLTNTTIARFYEAIPLNSKKFARGDYNPLTKVIQWVYRSSEELNLTTRCEFDKVLNFNTQIAAFYPYTMTGTARIHDVKYIAGPGGSTVPTPVFKYLTSAGGSFTFSEERSNSYVDWASTGTSYNYESTFTTGYKLHGGAINSFQSNYVIVYSGNAEDTEYKIQGIWDFAIIGLSGRYSSRQLVTIDKDLFGNFFRKHKIRGHGRSLQFKFISSDGKPFNILGWAIWETANQQV